LISLLLLSHSLLCPFPSFFHSLSRFPSRSLSLSLSLSLSSVRRRPARPPSPQSRQGPNALFPMPVSCRLVPARDGTLSETERDREKEKTRSETQERARERREKHRGPNRSCPSAPLSLSLSLSVTHTHKT